jgi:hypothetical protein
LVLGKENKLFLLDQLKLIPPILMKLIMTISVAFCVLFANLETQAQEQSLRNFREFRITITRTEKGVKMQSDQGSEWTDLSFTLDRHSSQAIDENGMTTLGNLAYKNSLGFAHYLLTISLVKGKLIIKGIEGTAWKELTFTLQENASQTINHLGMIK